MLPPLCRRGRRSCQVRVPARRGRWLLARRRSASPDAHPVRALVRQSRGRPGHHGSLRLGAPLGALAERSRHRGASCCRPLTCAPMSSATRPMRPMPARCSKRRAAPTSRRCASSRSSSRRCRGCTARARCGWPRAPRASTRCAASAASSASPSRKAAASASSRSAACWPIRTRPCPTLIRGTMTLLVEEIRLLEARIAQLERELDRAGAPVAGLHHAAVDSRRRPAHRHRDGGGHLAATSATSSDARHFASWFGLTPKEHSSGSTRHLGRISKRGDRYLRMLLTHGARSRAARRQRGRARRQDRRRPAPLGAGRAGPHQSQQGHLRAGQQAGAHLLRHAARRRALRQPARLNKKDRRARRSRMPA